MVPVVVVVTVSTFSECRSVVFVVVVAMGDRWGVSSGLETGQ